MKAGNIRVEITFSIDADGILSVSSFEKISQRSHIIEIKPSYGLDEDEINNILESAYKNVYIDHQNKLLQETIINTKSLIYNVEAAIKEMPKQLLAEDERAEIYLAIMELQKYMDSNNRELIVEGSKKFEALTEKLIAQRLNYTIEQLLKGKHVEKI